MSEKNHTVNESNEKVRVTTTVKRGTGTRDQDTHKLKVRAENPQEAAEQMHVLLRELENADVYDRVRDIQNDEE
jgi:hypothetical protein